MPGPPPSPQCDGGGFGVRAGTPIVEHSWTVGPAAPRGRPRVDWSRTRVLRTRVQATVHAARHGIV